MRQKRKIVWLAGVVVVDFLWRYWAISANSAVINQAGSGGVEVPAGLIVLGILGVGYLYYIERSIWLLTILVGGITNQLSRFVWGGVVDYLSFGGLFYNNLADYLIILGVVGYGYSGYLRRRSVGGSQ